MVNIHWLKLFQCAHLSSWPKSEYLDIETISCYLTDKIRLVNVIVLLIMVAEYHELCNENPEMVDDPVLSFVGRLY